MERGEGEDEEAGVAGRSYAVRCARGPPCTTLNGKIGVKDFDVWSFYAARGDGPFPYRWRGTADYGPSRFGRHPDDPPKYVGRRVDFLGRSLPALPGADPAEALRRYLSTPRTRSAIWTICVPENSHKHGVPSCCAFL